MEVSLTNFVDFATKAGMSQISALKLIKRQQAEEYAVFRDYYKKLRDGIVDYHRNGKSNKQELNSLSNGLPKGKVAHYVTLIKGYKKFLGRKETTWFEPAKTNWVNAGLTVRMNPELGLEFSGKKHLIKLYFKNSKLTKRLAEPLLHLMAEALSPEYDDKVPTMGILDIRNAGYFSYEGKPDPNVLLLLSSHANSFVSMYDKII